MTTVKIEEKYFLKIETPIGELFSLFTKKGISLLAFKDGKNFYNHLKKIGELYGKELVKPELTPLSNKLKLEIEEYFKGVRKSFNLPLDLRGTDFQLKVWNELRKIPYGETASYTELAIRVKNENYKRAVAMANSKNRILILVSCHRVVNKNGNIGGFSGGVWRKKFLLELEKYVV